MRGFRRTAAPGHYNLRFKPSQGLDGVYLQYYANIHGAEGHETVNIITIRRLIYTEILANF